MDNSGGASLSSAGDPARGGSAPPVVLLLLALYVFFALFKRRVHEVYVLTVYDRTSWYSWSHHTVKSNYFKCRLFDFFQEVIYFRPFGDMKRTLSLDGCDEATAQKRVQGYRELEGELKKLEHLHCASDKLVDCRFKKVKVLFPLLKELERKYPNRVERVEDDATTVVCSAAPGASADREKKLLYLSLDAVRVFGRKFYEDVHAEAHKRFAASAVNAAAITQNPEMEKNMDLLATLTGMQKFRYTLSGSEAVDACFKDVRLSTGKKYVVRFRAAYHGHTSGVDALSALGEDHRMIYLNEMDDKTLLFLEEYHYLIAAVIVNPMMFFTGVNAMSPPGEKMTAGKRDRPQVTREQYAEWLHKLNEKCQYCTKYLTPMAFVLDDVYFAFRVPELFSFQYFAHPLTKAPLDPDQIILGKGVAAGLPLSVICGKKSFAMNYDPDYLLKINKVVGTLSAYPMGVIASNVFLEKFVDRSAPEGSTTRRKSTSGAGGSLASLLFAAKPTTADEEEKNYAGDSSSTTAGAEQNLNPSSPDNSTTTSTLAPSSNQEPTKQLKQENNIRNSLCIERDLPRPPLARTEATDKLRAANLKFDAFSASVNSEFEKHQLPLRLRNHANTFTVDYLADSLYNSLFVQHLIANGVFVTNQSTGKFNLLMDWVEPAHEKTELGQLKAAFVKSGQQMQRRGFFVEKGHWRKSWRVFASYAGIAGFAGSYLRICYDQIMEDKRIDIEVSHNHPVNKFTHFWSSVFMILFAYSYIGLFGWYKEGFLVFLITHVLRQAGHFFYEKQDRNYEKLKFGHKDGSKKAAAVGVAAAIYVFLNLESLLAAFNRFLGGRKTFVWLYRAGFLPLMVERLGYWNISDPASDGTNQNQIESAAQNYYRTLERDPRSFQYFNLTDEQFVVISGLFTIVPHFADIVHEFGWVRGWEWFLKILTDPFTDLLDFYQHWIIHPREFLDFKKQFGVYELDYETKKVKDKTQ